MQLCELVSPESHRYAFLSPRSKMAIGEAFAYLFSLLYIVDLYNHKFLRYGTVTIESRIHTILITIVNLEFLEFGYKILIVESNLLENLNFFNLKFIVRMFFYKKFKF